MDWLYAKLSCPYSIKRERLPIYRCEKRNAKVAARRRGNGSDLLRGVAFAEVFMNDNPPVASTR